MSYSAATGKLTAAQQITSGSLSTGKHTVYMRAKDAADNWSGMVSKSFNYR
jgi:hypothetical protein